MQIQASSFIFFQIAGWSLYALIQSLSFTVQGYEIGKSLFLSCILAAVGLVITSVMRKLYISDFVKGLKTFHLFIVCIFVCLIASAIMTLFVHLMFTSQLNATISITFDSLADQFLTNYFQLLPMFFIWSLLYFAIKYFRQLNETEVEKVRLEASLKEARLNTLKGQINPHFLFNNLNNLRALTLEDVNAAREGLSSLAEVLRYSLSSEEQDKVTLNDELVVVNDFIALAKLHYENKLSLTFNIPDECLSCFIPVMSLQMLVENAIKHGIAKHPDGGTLQIDAKCDTKNLLLKVKNPGYLALPKRESKLSTGTGVKNITQRLDLLYGQEAKFELNQGQEQVIASLTLPKENMI